MTEQEAQETLIRAVRAKTLAEVAAAIWGDEESWADDAYLRGMTRALKVVNGLSAEPPPEVSP